MRQPFGGCHDSFFLGITGDVISGRRAVRDSRRGTGITVKIPMTQDRRPTGYRFGAGRPMRYYRLRTRIPIKVSVLDCRRQASYTLCAFRTM
jgi:hypothetical protein